MGLKRGDEGVNKNLTSKFCWPYTYDKISPTFIKDIDEDASSLSIFFAGGLVTDFTEGRGRLEKNGRELYYWVDIMFHDMKNDFISL